MIQTLSQQAFIKSDSNLLNGEFKSGGKEDGMGMLIAVLDNFSLKELMDSAYEVYKNFDSSQRLETMSI